MKVLQRPERLGVQCANVQKRMQNECVNLGADVVESTWSDLALIDAASCQLAAHQASDECVKKSKGNKMNGQVLRTAALPSKQTVMPAISYEPNYGAREGNKMRCCQTVDTAALPSNQTLVRNEEPAVESKVLVKLSGSKRSSNESNAAFIPDTIAIWCSLRSANPSSNASRGD